MISGFWRVGQTNIVRSFLIPQLIKTSPQKRSTYHYLPPSQYDWPPLPFTMRPLQASKVYYEIIPIIMTSTFSLGMAAAYIVYMCFNKLDVVWTTHNLNMKNRTMNLCKPVIYKFITINQRYDPWPEMQRILDKMKEAERILIEKAAVTPLGDCKKKK